MPTPLRIDLAHFDRPGDARSLRLFYDVSHQGHAIHKILYGPYETQLSVVIAFVPDSAPTMIQDMLLDLQRDGLHERRTFGDSPVGWNSWLITHNDAAQEKLEEIAFYMDEWRRETGRPGARLPSLDNPMSVAN